MKKTAYYLSPFVIVPIIFLIATLLENAEILKPIVPYFMFALLFLYAVVIGMLSPLKVKFDCVMAALVPFSVFFALFIALLFDDGCDGMPQFSLHHALNIAQGFPRFPLKVFPDNQMPLSHRPQMLHGQLLRFQNKVFS